MEIDPFQPSAVAPAVPTMTKAQSIKMAVAISKGRTIACGRNLLDTYNEVRKRVYQSSDYSSDEFYAELGQEGSSELKQWAVLCKTVVNFVKPGTIVDDVPEATITMPGGA